MTRPKKLGSGLVALLAHVEPALRERVRSEAKSSGRPISDIVSEALGEGLHWVIARRCLVESANRFARDIAAARAEWERAFADIGKRGRHG